MYSTIFASPLNRRSNLKGKNLLQKQHFFFLLRAGPILKSYLIQRSKQKFMKVNIKLFSEKRQGTLIRAGVFTRIIMAS